MNCSKFLDYEFNEVCPCHESISKGRRLIEDRSAPCFSPFYPPGRRHAQRGAIA